MPLAPRAAVLLDMLHRIDAPRLHELPVEVARRSFYKLMYAYREEPEAVASAVDIEISRREHAGGALPARLYRPAGTSPETVLPVMLWLHGGGWVLGDLESYDPWCRALANACGIAVLALDYRLAPEHQFPAGVDDAWFALKWLASAAAGLQLDAAQVTVGGDSAGGTLAAVLCLMARDAGGPAIAQQLLIYPATDLLTEFGSARQYGAGHFLERETMLWFQHNYFARELEKHDWRASPMLAASHAGLPPALVITAECDPLADDGAAYAAKLVASGVAARHLQFEGMVHGFVTMFKLFVEARMALDEIAAALRAARIS
ncbi:alpha/beta hydrolase [Uliginosibacterium flavum]|uniref:Alpha/beta hydrolase n=1 Tax=Uliginosibacterium flavum TaxID=1396831 RepID=A0ABV2TPD3_9RHOO